MSLFNLDKPILMIPKKIVLDDIKGRELPPDWVKRADLQPEAIVSITIQETEESIANRLLKTMQQAGMEADKNGINDLSEEEFETLLNDD